MTPYMHTPGSEIQMFMNLSLLFIISGFVRLAYIIIEHKLDLVAAFFADASMKSLPLPLAALCIYMLRSLNCCANANKYLFDDYKRILWGWKSNLLDPVSHFDGAPTPAVGWCWCHDSGSAVALPYDYGKKDGGDVLHKSCQALDVTIKLCTVNGCKKQRMLGMQITHEFRRRTMISLGTLALTVMMQAIGAVFKLCLANNFGQSLANDFGQSERSMIQI